MTNWHLLKGERLTLYKAIFSWHDGTGSLVTLKFWAHFQMLLFCLLSLTFSHLIGAIKKHRSDKNIRYHQKQSSSISTYVASQRFISIFVSVHPSLYLSRSFLFYPFWFFFFPFFSSCGRAALTSGATVSSLHVLSKSCHALTVRAETADCTCLWQG